MMQDKNLHSLIHRLPPVRGTYVESADLANMIWFRTGGPAEVLFRPADQQDLIAFLENAPADVPVTVIGVGSNVIVRDGGIKGVVIKLGKPFAEVTLQGDQVTIGAGAVDVAVANKLADMGLGGLEFLRGIPGSIGGAVVMNAGAYGTEMADVFVSARFVDRSGKVHERGLAEMGYSYRASNVPADWIVLSATLKGKPAAPEDIRARMDEISAAREASQPLRTKTGGSTFKNPNILGTDQRTAWQLVDQAGCRGLRRGDAVVSEKHCNFLINQGAATAAELEALGEDVRKAVKEKTGVTLEWEIRRLGETTLRDGEN